ncbi:hypothetical protein HYV69_04090 [Candidatus Uhrbacteria bacterium]|nr:hypothetical protein [Candidatus Uhrbacteria bacterium]
MSKRKNRRERSRGARPPESVIEEGAVIGAMEQIVVEPVPDEPVPDESAPDRSIQVEPVPGAPYKINIVQPDKANPGLEMTWCLSPEFLHDLADKLVFNPFMLILVRRKDGCPIEQMLVQLKRGGTRLEFYESGEFTIYTAIVRADATCDRAGQLSAFVSLTPIIAPSSSIIHYGRPQIKFIDSYHKLVSDFDEYKVNIDPEFFAPDPPAWLARWVNLWFEGKQKNECHFRRRMISAFSIQPPMILIWILLRAVCGVVYSLFLALIGWRWISLKPIFRPFAQDLKDINSNWSECSLKMAEGYWTIGRKSDKSFDKYPVFLRILFTPFLWVFVGLVSYFLVYRFPGAGIMAAKFLGCGVLAVIVLGIIAVIVARVSEAHESTAEEREKRKEARRVELKQIKEQLSREKINREFVELVCGAGGPADGHLRSIPKSHQTFFTRFEALKGRVCRPYAKG